MSITRLSGGLTPASGADPRTFPTIFNETADEIEAVEGRVTTAEGDILQLQTDVSTLDTDDVTEAGNLYYTDARVLAVAAPLLFEENPQTANYTLALSDSAKVVAMDSGSARTVTVPPDSTVAFPIGTVVNVYRVGTGSVTVAAGSGVTVRNAGAIRNQFGEVSLRKRGTDEWVLAGDVV
jgi:hypothetical protein